MPNQMSVTMTQVVTMAEPVHPIKGSLFGVGKKYRANCRHWAKTMRKWKKGPKTRTVSFYVPVATVEMVSTTPAEPRDGYWDESRKIPTSFEAEFTITPESRGLFLGQEV